MFSTQKRRALATGLAALLIVAIFYGSLGPIFARADAWITSPAAGLLNIGPAFGEFLAHFLSFATAGTCGALLVAGLLGTSARVLWPPALSVSLLIPVLAFAAAATGVTATMLASIFSLASCLVLATLVTRAGQVPLAGSESRAANLIKTGRLDAAFAELKACAVSARNLALFYELAEAYEAASKAHQARRVLRFLANRAITRTRQTLAGEPTRELPSGIPQTLGRYDIEGLLGRGAMGAVYLARDTRINRSVALKVVSLEREFDPNGIDDARGRFFQEAESAGRLHHPDIVTIYDAAEVGELSYIAMEYVTGKPLADWDQKKDPIEYTLAIELIARAADALAYAHERKVIHRDIKPANLLYDADRDQLKIMDFGVAQLADVIRTRTGIILGTPAYMSPEQLLGEPLNGHSDLYSLGVTLYELLTGEVPFKADNMVGFAKAVTTGKPRPVSLLRSDLPRSLDGVINKALARMPAERFESGWTMADALRSCIAEDARDNTLNVVSN